MIQFSNINNGGIKRRKLGLFSLNIIYRGFSSLGYFYSRRSIIHGCRKVLNMKLSTKDSLKSDIGFRLVMIIIQKILFSNIIKMMVFKKEDRSGTV